MPGKGARARYRKKRAERHAEFLKEACTKIAEPQRPGDQADCSTKPLVSYRALPTIARVDSSSTGVPRLWGALNKSG